MNGKAHITNMRKKYELDHVVLNYHKAIGHKALEFYNWDKYYLKEEIENSLNKNGFKIIDIYSDTIGNKDFKANKTMFIICQKI